MRAHKETLGFQAEVKQLLHLMIHSLYSNKEIFLRELMIQRVGRLRQAALRGDRQRRSCSRAEPSLRSASASTSRRARSPCRTTASACRRDEVVEHLGTIAKSGTREFFASLSGDQQKDAQLIGQFGVGFYSSFIVADRVTRRHPPRRAAGRGGGALGIATARATSAWNPPSATRARHRRHAAPARRRGRAALRLEAARDRDARTPTTSPADPDEEVSGRTAARSRPTRTKPSTRRARCGRGQGARSATSSTRRSTSTSRTTSNEPLAWTHNRVEGRTEYTQLLYIPARAPFDLWDRNQRHGIKLYVRRVFIMDDAEQLMPAYLRFVRGVIDSADLPLNVSREILQESQDVEAIREGSTKRVLALLEDLAENQKDKYADVLERVRPGAEGRRGRGFRQPRRASPNCCASRSTASDTDAQTVSLADYVGAHEGRPGQDLHHHRRQLGGGASTARTWRSSARRASRCCCLSDRVDEWMLGFLTEFEGKPLVSVAQGGLDLGALEDEAEKTGAGKDRRTSTRRWSNKVKAALGERVKEVRVTLRLTDSPACLVADEHDMSGNLQRLLKAAGQKAPESRPILEINPSHPLVARMAADEARLRRLGQSAVRSGAARRRRPARRSGRVRQARQPAAAGVVRPRIGRAPDPGRTLGAGTRCRRTPAGR